MGEKLTNELGTVDISENVIAVVAGAAAMKCYGLVGMAARNIQDGIAELLRQEHLERGVDIHLDGRKVSVGLYVIIEYGTKISEVALNIQEQVKYAIESQLGLDVEAVNVYVQGVRVTNPRKKKNLPEG